MLSVRKSKQKMLQISSWFRQKSQSKRPPQWRSRSQRSCLTHESCLRLDRASSHPSSLVGSTPPALGKDLYRIDDRADSHGVARPECQSHGVNQSRSETTLGGAAVVVSSSTMSQTEISQQTKNTEKRSSSGEVLSNYSMNPTAGGGPSPSCGVGRSPAAGYAGR